MPTSVRDAAAAFEACTDGAKRTKQLRKQDNVSSAPPAFLQQKQDAKSPQMNGVVVRKTKPESRDTDKSGDVAEFQARNNAASRKTFSNRKDDGIESYRTKDEFGKSEKFSSSRKIGDGRLASVQRRNRNWQTDPEPLSESDDDVAPFSRKDNLTSGDATKEMLAERRKTLNRIDSFSAKEKANLKSDVETARLEIEKRKRQLNRVDSFAREKAQEEEYGKKEIRTAKLQLQHVDSFSVDPAPSEKTAPLVNLKPVPPPPPAPPRPPPPPPPSGFQKTQISEAARLKLEKIKQRPRKRPDWSDLMKEIEDKKKLRKVVTNDRSAPLLTTMKLKGQFVYESEKPDPMHQLLQDIQKGKTLRKVVTKDRSKPMLDGLKKLRRQLTTEEQKEIPVKADPELDDIDKLRDELQSTKQILDMEMKLRQNVETKNLDLLAEIKGLKKMLGMDIKETTEPNGQINGNVGNMSKPSIPTINEMEQQQPLLNDENVSKTETVTRIQSVDDSYEKNPEQEILDKSSSLVRQKSYNSKNLVNCANVKVDQEGESPYVSAKPKNNAKQLPNDDNKSESEVKESENLTSNGNDIPDPNSSLDRCAGKTFLNETLSEKGDDVQSKVPAKTTKKSKSEKQKEKEKVVEIKQETLPEESKSKESPNGPNSLKAEPEKLQSNETNDELNAEDFIYEDDVGEAEESEIEDDAKRVCAEREIRISHAKFRNCRDRYLSTKDENAILYQEAATIIREIKDVKKNHQAIRKELDSLAQILEDKGGESEVVRDNQKDDDCIIKLPQPVERPRIFTEECLQKMPLLKQKQKLMDCIGALEDRTTQLRKQSYLLKSNMAKLHKELERQKEIYRVMEAELNIVLTELA